MGASQAFRAIGDSRSEQSLAFVTTMNRCRVGTPNVAGIAEWIVFLRSRISGTVGTAGVTATGARLVTGNVQMLTLATIPTHALALLLVDQILASCFAGLDQWSLLRRVHVPIHSQRWVIGPLLEKSSALRAACGQLGLSTLRWVAWAVAAASVLAIDTLLGRAEGVLTFVACAVDTHADRLLNTQSITFGRVPLIRLDVEPEPLT